MGKLIDLTGQQFGRLTVIARAGTKNGHAVWLCQCECGQQASISGYLLISGETRSCGCLRAERATVWMQQLQAEKGADGRKQTRLYRIWRSMKNRCNYEKNDNYADYGGRGITVCEEWLESFDAFRKWAESTGYEENLSIDRIDVNGNYQPDNCRWVTMTVQQNNRRNNHRIEYDGRSNTIMEWSRITGLSQALITNRLKSGWSIERALTEPVHNTKRNK